MRRHRKTSSRPRRDSVVVVLAALVLAVLGFVGVYVCARACVVCHAGGQPPKPPPRGTASPNALPEAPARAAATESPASSPAPGSAGGLGRLARACAGCGRGHGGPCIDEIWPSRRVSVSRARQHCEGPLVSNSLTCCASLSLAQPTNDQQILPGRATEALGEIFKSILRGMVSAAHVSRQAPQKIATITEKILPG